METITYKGYKVEVYESYYGDDVYITKDGESIYKACVTRGQAMDRVKFILG